MPDFSQKYRIAFFGVPKVASTSVKSALYELEEGRPFRREEHGGRHIHDVWGTHAINPENAFRKFADYWKFTVVRDPIERILSLYRNRVAHHQDLETERLARLRAVACRIRLRPDLDEFCLRIERYRRAFPSIRHHSDPLGLFLGPDLSRFDAVYRLDQTEKLAAALSERTGREVTMPRMQTGGTRITADMLSDRAFAFLVDYTAAEYALLGGLYAPPQRS